MPYPTLSPNTKLVLLSRGRQTPRLGGPLIAHPAWRYTSFLGVWLVLYFLYLILPKGLRFQYCRSQRRRYAKSKYSRENLQAWIQAAEEAKLQADPLSPSRLSDQMKKRRSLVQGVLEEDARDEGRDESSRNNKTSPLRRTQPLPVAPSTSLLAREETLRSRSRTPPGGGAKRSVAFDSPSGYRSLNSGAYTTSTGTGNDKYTSGRVSFDDSSAAVQTTYTPKSWGLYSATAEVPPSPKHPAISTIPEDTIVEETLERLKGRGIRLIAHGCKCEPKRVWIRLEEETTSVTWQTEFPRRIPTNLTGDVSIVLMRGSLHKIALPNVLYIDVGKKTTALKKFENSRVQDEVCFSLLTQNGSLDLQANSLMERDALVACFAMILDQVHTQDWRKLYEESPPTSQAMSSSTSNGSGQVIRSDLVEV